MIRQRDGGRNQAAAQQMEREEGRKECRSMQCTGTFAERNLQTTMLYPSQ